ncbi:hypothetical protein PG988_000933 [Apiospora saccharicola]
MTSKPDSPNGSPPRSRGWKVFGNPRRPGFNTEGKARRVSDPERIIKAGPSAPSADSQAGGYMFPFNEDSSTQKVDLKTREAELNAQKQTHANLLRRIKSQEFQGETFVDVQKLIMSNDSSDTQKSKGKDLFDAQDDGDQDSDDQDNDDQKSVDEDLGPAPEQNNDGWGNDDAQQSQQSDTQEYDAWGQKIVQGPQRFDEYGNPIVDQPQQDDGEDALPNRPEFSTVEFNAESGRIHAQAAIDSMKKGAQKQYFAAKRTDIHGNRFAATVSEDFPSVLFVQEEITNDNDEVSLGTATSLPYDDAYLTSVGNAQNTAGLRSVLRLFNARMGYAKMKIFHFIKDAPGDKEFLFATTELHARHTKVHPGAEGFAFPTGEGDELSDDIAQGYEDMGLSLSQEARNGVNLDEVPAYQMSMTVKSNGIRHFTSRKDLESMEAIGLTQILSRAKAVNDMFSRNKTLRFTCFFPGFDDQCLRTFSKFEDATYRTQHDPYLGMLVKVPTVKVFTNLNQMVNVDELKPEKQESGEIVFEDMTERTVRLSYGVRDDFICEEAQAEFLKTRVMNGIYITMPNLTMTGRPVGLIPNLQPSNIEALPRLNESFSLVPHLTYKTQTPPT